MSGCNVVLLALAVFTVVWIGTMWFEWRLEKSRRRWMEKTMGEEGRIPPQSPLVSSKTRQEGTL